MPRVRIESLLTVNGTVSKKIMNTVMDVIVEILKLLPDDRTVSYQAFKTGHFQMKPPYHLFIEISLFKGRSSVVKKKLYKAIVERLEEKHDIKPDTVMIMLNEQPRENWALRGGIGADEIHFDYTIEQ